MNEKPILFNTEMVQAILSGRKTQTRRIIKPQPKIPQNENDIEAGEVVFWKGQVCRMKEPRARSMKAAGNRIAEIIEPYSPGDILWVRETWKQYTAGTAGPGLIDGYLYKADEPQDTSGMMVEDRWHPSIHMPRNAARLFLQITDVYTDRLQAISEDDAMAEGASGGEYLDEQGNSTGIVYPHEEFINIWNSTINPDELSLYGWDANPWVWVISFEKI